MDRYREIDRKLSFGGRLSKYKSTLNMEEVSNRVFVDPVSYLNRFIKDIKDLRGSFLLMAVFWPVAIITVFLAQVERFWAIGSSYNNSSHLVSDNNEEIMNLMLMLSSSELSKKIRDTNDSLTSVALVTACIGQIRKTNVFLNAVVVSRFAKALEEAEAADAAVRMNTIPENSPFWGVPLVIKECMEMPNMAYTTGIVSRKHIVGTNIAVAVQHTIDAGGIIVATTNVSEGCMWHESFNQVVRLLKIACHCDILCFSLDYCAENWPFRCDFLSCTISHIFVLEYRCMEDPIILMILVALQVAPVVDVVLE